jgi:hypothetical protein
MLLVSRSRRRVLFIPLLVLAFGAALIAAALVPRDISTKRRVGGFIVGGLFLSAAIGSMRVSKRSGDRLQSSSILGRRSFGPSRSRLEVTASHARGFTTYQRRIHNDCCDVASANTRLQDVLVHSSAGCRKAR